MYNSQYYLTFDIGSSNLAYSIVEYSDDPKLSILDRIKIIKWRIIDISYKPLYCKQIKNKRAICNCVSTYYTLIDDNNEPSDHTNLNNLVGYCKIHAKPIQTQNALKSKSKIKTKLFRISANKIYQEDFNKQMQRLLDELILLYDKYILAPYDWISPNAQYVNNLQVYIENQPAFKTPVMKTISIVIFTFFSLKRYSHPKIIQSINLISASTKTQLNFINKLSTLFNIKSKIPYKDLVKYHKRKLFIIDITNQLILKFTPKILNIVNILYFNTQKKQDDLGDCLVYVVYILLFKQKKII